MKIIKKVSGYAHITVDAELEGDEATLNKEVLVMMADGIPRERAIAKFAAKEHPGHFGYRDYRVNGSMLHVVIHTD